MFWKGTLILKWTKFPYFQKRPTYQYKGRKYVDATDLMEVITGLSADKYMLKK
jgi:hypothetical protein